MMSISANPLIPRVSDEQVVAQSWEHFMHDRPLPAAGVRRVILHSWQRCRGAVDPLRRCAPGVVSSEVMQLRTRSRDLYQAAKPVLEALRGVLYESGSLLMLTDDSGTILDLHGETRARSAGEQINLAPGGRWSEELIGTNAIGTAIATGESVQIYASEHYCLDVKPWTCAAAPIFDPLSKSLLGAIDISGSKQTFHGHTLGLVIAAAKQIESLLLRQDTELHEQLLQLSASYFQRYAHDGVALFDRRGRLLKSNSAWTLLPALQGLNLPLHSGGVIESLNLEHSLSERRRTQPQGWCHEWVHALHTPAGELGSLLVIPLSKPCALAAEDPFAQLVGESEVMRLAKRKARRMAAIELPVLLLGETGAGKELFARALHNASARRSAPFVALNCGALTRDLLASELFGYSEGAFTGARRSGLPGKFEQADGGTLFLDEIGELPLDMQPHLLRVLQDGVVVRLGDTRERCVAVRIIAATNRDLLQEVQAGRFREDLFHRLCVINLCLPALRERPGDIELIIAHLNAKLAQKYACAPKLLEPNVLQALLRYHWPGNVRELHNVFEAMFALSEGLVIDAGQLPARIAASTQPKAVAEPDAAERLADVERQAIRAALDKAQGNISMAARTLGISRSTLYVKLAAMRA